MGDETDKELAQEVEVKENNGETPSLSPDVVKVYLSNLQVFGDIQDYETALENIELCVDSIDAIVDYVENNPTAVQFLLDNELIESFSKMLSSPCEEVVKVALNGLDRLLSVVEFAVRATKIGLGPVVINLFTNCKGEDQDYQRTKASDVLSILIAPPQNKHLKESLLESEVYDGHVQMLLSGSEELLDRSLQFMWALTNEYEAAQTKLARNEQAMDKLYYAILDTDSGRNALRILLNVVKSSESRKTLQLANVQKIALSILNIPENYVGDREKAIASLILAFISDEKSVDAKLVADLASLLDLSLHEQDKRVSLRDILKAIENLARVDASRKLIGNSTILKDLIEILTKEEKTAVLKGIFDLEILRLLSSLIIFQLIQTKEVAQKLREGDVIEILKIHSESVDADLVESVKRILEILESKSEETVPAQPAPEQKEERVPSNKDVSVEANHEATKNENHHQEVQVEGRNRRLEEIMEENEEVEKEEIKFIPVKVTEDIAKGEVDGHARADVRNWDYLEVTRWLVSVGLGEYGETFQSLKINGRALKELSRRVDSQGFVDLAEKNLKISIIGDVLVLADALRSL